MSKANPLLTPYQAAKAKGVNFRTVMVAIDLKELATADYAIRALSGPGTSGEFEASPPLPLIRYRDLVAWEPRAVGVNRRSNPG